MDVRVSDQDLERQLADLAASTGRAPDELVADALFAYFAELANVSDTLDRRYDDLKTGRVVPIDGDAALFGSAHVSMPTVAIGNGRLCASS